MTDENKTPETEAPAAAEAPAVPAPKVGVMATCRELIMKGWTDQEVLEEIHRRHADARSNINTPRFARNKLRKDGAVMAADAKAFAGELVPTNVEVGVARGLRAKPAPAAAPAAPVAETPAPVEGEASKGVKPGKSGAKPKSDSEPVADALS